MTPSVLLQELYGYGVKLNVVDGQIAVDAPKGVLTSAIREMLQREKQSILEIITKPIDVQYYRDRYEERAAIREYDGGLRRDRAEREAWIEVYCDYLEQHTPIMPHQFNQMILGLGRLQ